MAQQSDADESTEPQELADRHEGVAVSRESIQATMEYKVVLSTKQIDELPDNMSASEFAENVAASRMQKELDPTFSISPSDALASEDGSYIMNGERRFDVFVRVSQND